MNVCRDFERPYLLASACIFSKSTSGGGLVSKLCLTLATPWTVAPQAPLSKRFFQTRIPFQAKVPLCCFCCLVAHLFQLFVTPWTAARQASLSITNSQSLPKLMSSELVMPSNHLNLSRPPLLLPSIFPSIGVFSNELVFVSGG